MALEVVTNDHYGKNDKLKRMSRNMYTTREHGKKIFEFCMFCVLPSFVLKDNKCILSCVTECIVCVSVYDPLTFSFLFLFLFGWVGVLWPQLSKVLKLVHWARRVLFPPVFLQQQAVSSSCCLCIWFRGEPTLFPGWCKNKSYVIATSDLWLFIHASNLLPSLPTPLPYTCAIWNK